MKQHLGRQSGVQKVEVNLLDGAVDITPKEDGQIDPAALLKATYDSGVSVARMDVTLRGNIVQDAAGGRMLRVAPNRSFALLPNDLANDLASLAGSEKHVTVRGQLYVKPPGKKKAEPPPELKLLILEIQSKE